MVKLGTFLPLHVSVSKYLILRLSAGSLGEKVDHEISICLWYFKAQNLIDVSTYISAHTQSPGVVATLPICMCNPSDCARDNYKYMLIHFA